MAASLLMAGTVGQPAETAARRSSTRPSTASSRSTSPNNVSARVVRCRTGPGGRAPRPTCPELRRQGPPRCEDPAVRPGPGRDEFVGRGRELGRLVERLDRLPAGEGALVLVGGEPGIGKTRLGLELTRVAQEAGVPVRWGRCREEGAAPTFWPWRQVLPSATAAEGLGAVAAPEGSIDVHLSV